jgi:glycosyltransferase involved in cell wall biosynthesis
MKIEFIIPTYNRINHLMTTISSIFSQTNPNWTIHVVGDCPPTGTLDKIIEYYKDSDKIKFTILDKRYNDWGHTPRNYGLKNAKEEWIIMTGEDNYYAPIFVDEFLKSVTPKTILVYSNMVHNWVKNEYIAIKTKPTFGNVDIGCFMIKKRLSQGIELDVTKPDSDGTFLEEYLQQCPMGKIKHIEKFIYVHN